MKANLKKIKIYDYLSIIIILITFFLIYYHWNNTIAPTSDPYYHLSVVRGFDLAGGFVSTDFWQFAPNNNPHIYPPFLHFLLLFLFKCGLGMETLSRIASYYLFPLSLLTLWIGMRKLYQEKAAFYSLISLLGPFTYFSFTLGTAPTSLIAILTPLIFLAFESDKILTTSILLCFCLYSHRAMGHIIAIALFLYMLYARKNIKKKISIFALAYILYIPWLIYIILIQKNYTFLVATTTRTISIYGIHLFPLLIIGIIGFIITFWKEKKYFIPSAYLIATLSILYGDPARFFSIHSLLPLAMLSGITLATFHENIQLKMESLSIKKWIKKILIGEIFLIFPIILLMVDIMLFIPHVSKKATPEQIKNLEETLHSQSTLNRTTFQELINPVGYHINHKYTTWFTETAISIANVVKTNTELDDIFASPSGTINWIVTSFTGRSQALGGSFLPGTEGEYTLKDSKLIILPYTMNQDPFFGWPKDRAAIEKKLNEINTSKLIIIDKTNEILFLKRIDTANLSKRKIPKAIFPSNIAFALIGICIIIIILDVSRIFEKFKT